MPHSSSTPRRIAVALHDIEPATFERCALIRDWLSDHGVDRVTLLVIPARDLHPLGERSPEMTGWLAERRAAGDSIAQHGFQHERTRRGGLALLPPPALRGGEFVGLDQAETRRAVNAGWRVLKLAGIEPDGFVAPSYAYTPALRSVLPKRFRWWAGLLGVHRLALAAGEQRVRLLHLRERELGADERLDCPGAPELEQLAQRLPPVEVVLDDQHPQVAAVAAVSAVSAE